MRATRRSWKVLAHSSALAGAVVLALGVGGGVAAAQTGTSEIAGTVFNDLDGDGERQSSEPGIGSVTIQLRNSANQFLASTSTSQNGTYSFDGLEPGTYRVVQVANATGYSEDTTPNMVVVNLTGDVDDIDFGDARAAGESDSSVVVDGVVWVDEDRDGVFDPGEPGATDTRILIADEDYEPIVWLRPGPDARLRWEGDVGGPVVIRALPPEGWVGTTDLVTWSDPGGDGALAFGVAPPLPATTTTTTPETTTTAPPPSSTPEEPPTTGSPDTPGTPGTDGGGSPAPDVDVPDPTAPPPTTTTPPAVDVPINAALAPVPDDPAPRTATTTAVSIQVAGVQATRLAATGRDSSSDASSAGAMIAAGSLAVVAAAVLRRRAGAAGTAGPADAA